MVPGGVYGAPGCRFGAQGSLTPPRRGRDTLRPMITGFNTDVEYDGRTFHVQTEDRGQRNPVVESLVYSGGEIVASRKSGYDELLSEATYSEAAVLKLMETQHQTLVREIRNGRFDPEGPKPFGYNIITNRSLDQVVLDFLSRELGVEQIRLESDSHEAVLEGAEATLRFRVVADASDRPVLGAKVTVKLISTQERPKELFAGKTGPDGRIEAKVQIPALDSANAALLCQAEASGNNAELKRLIRKPVSPD